MPLVNPSDLLGNLLALGIILWIGFMVYNKMDKTQVHNTMEKIKGLFGKEE